MFLNLTSSNTCLKLSKKINQSSAMESSITLTLYHKRYMYTFLVVQMMNLFALNFNCVLWERVAGFVVVFNTFFGVKSKQNLEG